VVPHLELAKWLCDSRPGVKTLTLVPRGAYKSTMGVQDYVMWRILHNPDIRIVIDSETDRMSRDTVGTLKRRFESPDFQELFGDWTNDKNWTADALIVGQRTEEMRDATLMSSGVNRAKTGRHPDLIVFDDIVGKENVGSEDSRQKIIEHVEAMTALADPHTEFMFYGTRWHGGDLYSHILDNLRGGYRVVIRSADEDNKERYRAVRNLLGWSHDQQETLGDYYFPEVTSPEFLETQKAEETPEYYSLQYRNKPINPKLSLGTCQAHFTDGDVAEMPMRIVMAVDPHSESEHSLSATGIVVAGMNDAGNIYILYAKEHDCTPEEMVSLVFLLHAQYEPDLVRVERVGTDQSWRNISNEMQRRGYYFACEDYSPDQNKRKLDRIKQVLQPPYARGVVYHHISLKGGPYEEQLLYFGKTRRDDIVDAAAEAVKTLRPARVQIEKSRISERLAAGMSAGAMEDYIRSPEYLNRKRRPLTSQRRLDKRFKRWSGHVN